MSKNQFNRTSNSTHSNELYPSCFGQTKNNINQNVITNLETNDLQKTLTYTRFDKVLSDLNSLKSSNYLSDIKQSPNKVEEYTFNSNTLINLSDDEKLKLKSSLPIQLNNSENFDYLEEIPIWLKEENDIHEHKCEINVDKNPEIIFKKSNQKIKYIQELAIRYLRPPTPIELGEIIIEQEPNTLQFPVPPLIIRQQPPRPLTPEPLVVREKPPQAPKKIEPKIIKICGKQLPPPPRKVIIERLAQLPPKPQSVIIERWLPYPQSKRRVIFQKSNTVDPFFVKPKNVIVQWESPEVIINKDYKYIGIVKANPDDYIKKYGKTLKPAKDLPQFVLDIKPPEGTVLAADHQSSFHELEGDLKSLKYVDLEKEGLNSNSSYSTVLTTSQYRIEQIFPEISLKNDSYTPNTRG